MSVENLKKHVRKIFSEKTVLKLRKTRRKARYYTLKTLVRSRLLSKLYMLLFTREYDREIYGVVYGQIEHIKNKSGKDAINYHLRRSIHRIEKGLSMMPRRSIFAIDIISVTVESYARSLHEQRNVESAELKWANDVLTEYFRVCEAHPVIDSARIKFEGIIKQQESGSDIPSYIPYSRESSPSSTLSYSDFHNLSIKRRSVRWYEQKVVPHELIDRAVEIAALSPSACNRQPFEFRIIDDPELLSQCRDLPMGIKGFANNIPVMVAVIGKLRAYPEPRDRHIIYIDGGLASMSFMYALETLGLASCPINWPDIEKREMKAAKVLNLKPDQKIVMWISLGWPLSNGMIPYSSKIDIENIRTYN